MIQTISFVILGIGIAIAQALQPPQGVPEWLWLVLGAILPWLYAKFLQKFPGWLKWLLSWGITAVISILLGLFVFGFNLQEILKHYTWVVAVMQAIYQLFVKPGLAKPGYTGWSKK